MAVVIDVFRAFSVACYFFSRGAARVIALQDVAQARALKAQHPQWILAGERKGEKLAGFDCGNSPSEIVHANLSGKVVLHTTHAGTQSLCAVSEADEILTGSFVNAGAVVDYIQHKQPGVLSLVCAGIEDKTQSLEDLRCAEFIRDSVRGVEPRFEHILAELRAAPSSAKFFDPLNTTFPETDFELCLQLSKFPFVIRRTKTREGMCELECVEKVRI